MALVQEGTTAAWHSACQQIRYSLRAEEGKWHQPLQEIVTTMHHLGPVSACAHDPLPTIRAKHPGWGATYWCHGSHSPQGSPNPMLHFCLCSHHSAEVPFHTYWVPKYQS